MQCKKTTLWCFFSVLVGFSACLLSCGFAKVHAEGNGTGLVVSAEVSSEGLVPDKTVSNEVVSAKATQPAALSYNPQLERFSRVLSKMSPRFLEEIHISDVEEFLQDLNDILREEENFRDDDLSLFYLIDKKHSVGSDYVPKDLIPLKKNDLFAISRNDLSLRPEAYKALETLSRAALDDGIKLLVSSTYRSYTYQEGLFKRYVAQDGVELAERYSARPGTSQHQLGVAVDFGSITDDWGDTKMGKWVYEHAADYGWSLSFPRNYEDVTGYMWECWHFRYIGKAACVFQKKWFGNIQQFMLEFIDAWKKDSESDFSA
ncbi:MAG: M15 family metallopeptidase [Treponema sp.]|nr:M15 family metallopeptidase [Treponema sp.]